MNYSFNDVFTRSSPVADAQYQVDTIYEKGSSEINEDRLLVGSDLYGVFDGATSIDSRKLIRGTTGGALAAQIAKETFLASEAGLFDAAVDANRRIRLAQVGAGLNVNARHTLWTTSMAVVQILGDKLEYCQTGDALIVLLYEDGSSHFLTPEVDIDRETMVLWQKLNSNTKSEKSSIYTALNQQIRKVRLQMNREYGVLNGEPEAVDFIHHGTQSLVGVTDILLFTDGLYLPKTDPVELSDWTTFIDLYQRESLEGIRDKIRFMQNSDPELTIYPRFKLHDDIAAIALSRISPEHI